MSQQPTNAQVLQTLADHLGGYIQLMKTSGQSNVATVMEGQFGALVRIIGERLKPEEKTGETPCGPAEAAKALAAAKAKQASKSK